MIKRLHRPSGVPVVSAFDMSRKGLQLVETRDAIIIFSDPFCSAPLYLYESERDIRLFSDIERFLSQQGVSVKIDPVGFWEVVLFGLTFGHRTLFKNVVQLPAASRLTIDKSTSSFAIDRYWDFDIKEDTSISSKEMAAEGLHLHLSRIFNGLDSSAHYVMGLSGGLDSRLSLAFLSERVPPEQVKLFTFGFDERLLEREVSKNIALRLGFELPHFHLMRPEIYREALEYVPAMTGGEISIAHCHILSYLKNASFSGGLQLSNYYSDAVFGYSARANKIRSPKKGESSYYEHLRVFKPINADISEEIARDIAGVCAGYDETANFSSINEFLYVTERTPKFHMRLAFAQNKLLQTITPYADIELLKYMISVPLRYREQKKLMDEVFRKFYPAVQIESVGEMSSRFDAGFSDRAAWLKYRSTNLLNGLLRLATKGKMQVLNRLHTEELDRHLSGYFREDLKIATSDFVEMGLISSKAKSYFDRLPLRVVDTGMRYSLITLARFLSKRTSEI